MKRPFYQRGVGRGSALDTLFYCDPPYVHATRGDRKAYGYEMDDHGHRELAAAPRGSVGKVALSGYRCDLIDTLFEGWKRGGSREDLPFR